MRRLLADTDRWRGLLPLAMLTVVLIWSSNNIASKLVLRETSPGLLTLASTWSLATWLGLAYLIFVAGVCSQVLYAYGLRDVTPSQAMAFTYLMPVFTAFFAAIFLDEQVALATIVCGAAIVFGLWLVNRDRSRPAPRRSAGRPGDVASAAPTPSSEAG